MLSPRKERAGMKAQGLWKENNAGGFFVPKTVLSGGAAVLIL